MKNEESTTFLDEGVEVCVGFKATYTFYPLTWGTIRKFRKQYDLVFSTKQSDASSQEWMEAALDLLCASINRGNSQIDKDTLAEKIDFRNMGACFKALGQATGMKQVEKAVGTEVPPTSPLIGATSTLSSSAAQDGLLMTLTG